MTVDDVVASFLDDQPNPRAIVSEAGRRYCNRQLEHELEKADREDAAEKTELAAEWEAADAEVDE